MSPIPNDHSLGTDIVGNDTIRTKDRSLRTGVGAEWGEGGFLGSGPAGVRLNAGESLRERILGRDVLAVVAVAQE